MENCVEGPQKSESRVAIRSRKRISFPGGSDGKESACHAGDTASVPGSGRPPCCRTSLPLVTPSILALAHCSSGLL